MESVLPAAESVSVEAIIDDKEAKSASFEKMAFTLDETSLDSQIGSILNLLNKEDASPPRLLEPSLKFLEDTALRIAANLESNNDQSKRIPVILLQLPRILSLIEQLLDRCNFDTCRNADLPDDFKQRCTKIAQRFDAGQYLTGVRSLIDLRRSSPSYAKVTLSKSVSVLIKHILASLLSYPKPKTKPQLSQDPRPVKVTCPARIDFQGGWTDTPLICYELGGFVVNAAVKVKGAHPIISSVSKGSSSNQPGIKITERCLNQERSLLISSYEELLDIDDPSSIGALVKACLIISNVIDIPDSDQHSSPITLPCGSIEISIESLLPHGSGLGTSSILASALLASLWSFWRVEFSNDTLIACVLNLEQLLTTGGGWQDQVGGIFPGIKSGHSNPDPLQGVLDVHYKSIELSPHFRQKLEAHLMLIYTGTVRLAKNILSTVIKSWYRRDKQVVNCFENLLVNAQACRTAFEGEDLASIGKLLNEYWEQKKVLAANCEPPAVKQFFERSKSLLYGGSLCGAGGGGFMVVILKDPSLRGEVENIASEVLSGSQLYDVQIDEEGLRVTYD